jgi:branched-chain amino acid transport system permease protein
MQLLVNIVVLAAIYALIACGYVLIYRVSRVLNLAHGELMMLSATCC